MPTYNLLKKETGEMFEEYFTSYQEMEAFLLENPEYILGAPSSVNLATGSNISSFKTDDGFKDLLKSIKKSNKGSNIEV